MPNKIVTINDDEVVCKVSRMLHLVPTEKLTLPTKEEWRAAKLTWTDKGTPPRVEELVYSVRVQMTLKHRRFVLVTFPFKRNESVDPTDPDLDRHFVNRDECFLKACVIGDAAWHYLSAVNRRAVVSYAFSRELAEKNSQVPEVAEALEILAQHLLKLGLIKLMPEDAQTKRRTTVSKVMDAKFDEADKRLRKNLNILVEHQDKQHAELVRQCAVLGERLAIIEAKLDGLS